MQGAMSFRTLAVLGTMLTHTSAHGHRERVENHTALHTVAAPCGKVP